MFSSSSPEGVCAAAGCAGSAGSPRRRARRRRARRCARSPRRGPPSRLSMTLRADFVDGVVAGDHGRDHVHRAPRGPGRTGRRAGRRPSSSWRPLRVVARVGPCTTPPPANCGARAEPCRARPVPFWRYGFRPPPLTSPRVLVACVPCRAAASCATTTWCISGMFAERVEDLGRGARRPGSRCWRNRAARRSATARRSPRARRRGRPAAARGSR